jgi:ATP-dependent DNA helicase DinG
MLELAVDTPFNFSQQAVLVLPDMPDPRAPEYPEVAVSVTQRVIEICGGRTLVLCTSYRSLEALHNRLRRDRAHRVLRQGELPRTELAKIFREDEQSVLLGCESFWTGIDVPGPALTALVIDKLPFPNIQDPVVDAISDHNPAAFQEFMVPTAILMFRQGVGRLIRRADDVGAVVVLDCRLRTKGYGGRFLDSLPAMYQTANVEEIGQFLAWAGRPVAQDALGEQSELWARAPAPVDAGPPPLLDDEIPF